MKHMAQPHAMHIRIAVGEGNQAVAAGPLLEHWQDIVEALNLLPCCKKNLECRVGERRRLARRLEGSSQSFASQKAQIMSALRVRRVSDSGFQTESLFETLAPRLSGFEEPAGFSF